MFLLQGKTKPGFTTNDLVEVDYPEGYLLITGRGWFGHQDGWRYSGTIYVVREGKLVYGTTVANEAEGSLHGLS
jgi:hypothetical protein